MIGRALVLPILLNDAETAMRNTMVIVCGSIVLLFATALESATVDLDGPWYTGSSKGIPGLTNPNSDCFIWGGTSTATADTGTLWSEFPDMVLVNDGDAVTFSFDVVYLDAPGGTGTMAFRFGLFNHNGRVRSSHLIGTNISTEFDQTVGYLTTHGWKTDAGGKAILFVRSTGGTNPCSTTSGSVTEIGSGSQRTSALAENKSYHGQLTVRRLNSSLAEVHTELDGVGTTQTTGSIAGNWTFNHIQFLNTSQNAVDRMEFSNLRVAKTTAGVKTPINVYLLGGQSNMDGRADKAGLPAEWQIPQTDVLVYFEGSWHDLQPGLSFLQPGQSFGPELTFGRGMADAYPSGKVALIKYARGGTSLAIDWNPDSGPHYIAFMHAVTIAMQSLQGQYDPDIAGMIWMQGERDSKDLNQANAYEQNLTQFIQAVRRDTLMPDMPFVIGQISHAPDWTYGQTVRQAQFNVSQSADFTGLVTTSDLPMNADGIHYNSDGQMTLGRRFADVLFALEHACGQWGYGPGDFTLDCTADFKDFVWLSSAWMKTCSEQQVCAVMEDLIQLASHWLTCSFPGMPECTNYR
jgi:hypothetical protein